MISRNLFFERFGHLLRCGGLLPRGALHRWTAHESALLMLLDPYVEAGDWITLRVEQPSHTSGLTLLEVFEQQSRVEEAMQHGEDFTLARVKDGRHRRTEVRRASRVDGGTGGALPNPKDRDGKIVLLRDAEPGIYGSDLHGYTCINCGGAVHAIKDNWNLVDHWKHLPGSHNQHHPHHDCPYYKKGNKQKRVDGIDEASRMRIQGLLGMKIRRGFRGRGAEAFTDGGTEGHGLPLMARVDEDVKRFLTASIQRSENLDANGFAKAQRFAGRTLVESDLCPAVKITDPLQFFSCQIKMQRHSWRPLRGQALQTGDVFGFDDLTQINFAGHGGHGMVRLRPGLDHKREDEVIDPHHRYIGVAVAMDSEAANHSIDRPLRFSNDQIAIQVVLLDTEDPAHRVVLEAHGVLFQGRSEASVEVLVRKPIAAHPRGRVPARLTPEDSIELLVKTEVVEDAVEGPVAGYAEAVIHHRSSGQGYGRYPRTSPIPAPTLPDGWASFSDDARGDTQPILHRYGYRWAAPPAPLSPCGHPTSWPHTAPTMEWRKAELEVYNKRGYRIKTINLVECNRLQKISLSTMKVEFEFCGVLEHFHDEQLDVEDEVLGDRPPAYKMEVTLQQSTGVQAPRILTANALNRVLEQDHENITSMKLRFLSASGRAIGDVALPEACVHP